MLLLWDACIAHAKPAMEGPVQAFNRAPSFEMVVFPFAAARPAARPVVCRAQLPKAVQKVAAASVAIPAWLAAHPAFALVRCQYVDSFTCFCYVRAATWSAQQTVLRS